MHFNFKKMGDFKMYDIDIYNKKSEYDNMTYSIDKIRLKPLVSIETSFFWLKIMKKTCIILHKIPLVR